MSSAGLEWVRAPTATKSTPVSATARAVSSRSPPLASSRVRGVAAGQGDGRAQVGQVHVVEQDEPGAGLQRLADLVQGVALHLERQRGCGRADGGDRRGDPAGRRDVVVLDERGVAESHPVVAAAAAPHGVLLQLAQPRGGLAGVPDRAAGAGQGVGPGAGRGGDPGQVSEEVEQGPFGPEQLAHRGGDADQLGARLDPVTVGAQRLGATPAGSRRRPARRGRPGRRPARRAGGLRRRPRRANPARRWRPR